MTEKDTHVTKQLSTNPKFEVGDVVKLVSDGPSMTIREIDGNDIFCEWFDKAVTRSHTFLKAQLVHTNPGQLPIISINRFGSSGEKPPWEYLDEENKK